MTRLQLPLALAVGSLAAASALQASATATLADVCTVDYVQSILPADGFEHNIVFDADSVTANAVYDYNVTAGDNFPAATDRNFCNVTFTYTREGGNATTELKYWLPAPKQFNNRYLTTGGFGYAISGDEEYLPSGLVVGAVSGTTNGGIGAFGDELTAVILNANGSLNYEHLYDFAYLAIHQLTQIGKEVTKNFYNASKIYSYYQGCSEGGREGWSQVQRYQTQFDGAAIGAPAFRQAFQQVNHIVAAVTEKAQNYAPPPCELERILNDTISACDGLDGRVDGVVSRTDLCYYHYNATSSIGNSYNCAASSGSGGFGKRQMAASSTPAQNGTVSAEAAELVNLLYKGLHDSQGRRVYLGYQPTATFTDAETTYNTTTDEWEVSSSGMGVSIAGQYLQRFLKEVEADTISLDGVTYDTVRSWMLEGLRKFDGTLETTWPDLTEYRQNGGKIIHYHGESDYSIPAASSVRYYEMAKSVMHPGLSDEEATEKFNEFYRLFLVPGAGHCAPSTDQPNGPFPQSVLESIIAWVEDGVNPKRLNATVIDGTVSDKDQKICSWPLRPKWTNNGTEMDCVKSEVALENFYPKLDSIPVVVY
ncbi:tannase and feruloyl esterase [Microstroma glucosiphilum]|uniref:Carboxylic ester hydrolase n=1 Tax=Pseudomicrostroma glucosiphilum TaxID=1684307 RepID=A0A316UE54_9BASI|nr:tannase and feruloyl esterase [Pseudomicrostroma glucosiphilum]PWN23496.1 tannase and feruloyl esterase [Pseudomicrostroma glucosiphilum]